jgi:hypothetical protein
LNSLQSRLVSENYDDLALPVDKREVSGVLVKKKRNVPEHKITFQNFKRAVVGRRPAANVIRTEGGVMPRAQNADSELDCFKLFFDDHIITTITNMTNLNITNFLDQIDPVHLEQIRTKNTYIRPTTEEEMLAYFGLAYLRGYFQWNYWDLPSVWSSHPIFPATMSLNRY